MSKILEIINLRYSHNKVNNDLEMHRILKIIHLYLDTARRPQNKTTEMLIVKKKKLKKRRIKWSERCMV